MYDTIRYMGKKVLIVFLIFAILAVAVGLSLTRGESFTDTNNEGLVITSNTDSDNDGVPDWQEEIAASNPHDDRSFPYKRDLALIQDITVDELLYPGPSTFVGEIVQRVLEGGDGVQLSNAEQERFVEEASSYFIEQVNRRGTPNVDVQINANADRGELANQFLSGIEGFANLSMSVGQVVAELLAGENVAREAQEAALACETARRTLPRETIPELYEDYSVALTQIIYLCETLDVARNGIATEDYFYIIKLSQGLVGDASAGSGGRNSQPLSEESLNFIYNTLNR